VKIKLLDNISWHLARSPETIQEARTYADSLYLLSKRAGNPAGMGRSYLRLGNLEKILGNYPVALHYLDSALKYYEPLEDTDKIADILYDLGAIHRSMGNYELSLPYYYRVLEISKMENNQVSEASTLTSIGIVHRLLKQYDAALENYTRAVEMLEKLDKPTRLAAALSGMGSVYAELADYPQAGQYYRRSLAVNEKLGNQREIGYNLSNLGHLEETRGAYTEALDYYLRALRIRGKIPRKEDLALAYRNVGAAYLKLDQLEKSADYLKKGLAISNEIHATPISRDIYGMLGKISEKKKDYASALRYQRHFMAAKDSVVNAESEKQLANARTRFELQQRENEILLLQQQNTLQEQILDRQTLVKQASLAGLALLTAVAILIIYMYRQRLRSQRSIAFKDQEIREVNHQRQLSELEMKALQAQINPHFIFNCLNSINQMIQSNQNEHASKYLAKFGKLIRMILENAESVEVSLKDELQLLEAYIQLEGLRFEGKINYEISFKNSLDPENTFLPSMLIQPFVENAIWHGLLNRPNPDDGLISIAFEQQDDELICEIVDNGIGRQKAIELKKPTIWKGKSLGLKLTEERLKLMGSALKSQLVKIADLKDNTGEALGTRVTVIIPMM